MNLGRNPAATMLAVDLRLALRNILRQRRRSLIALAAIGFGVVSMMLTAGFIEWIFWANREGVSVTQLGHIQVVKQGFHEDGQADPHAFMLPGDAGMPAILENTRGVRAVSPRIEFTGLVSHGETTLTFLGMGIDPEKDPSMRYLSIKAGAALKPGDSDGILIGTGLAANLGVKVGDRVVLLANTQSGGINATETTVRGLASTSMRAFDDSMLRVPIEMARKLLRVSGSHVWVVTLSDTDLTDSAMKVLVAEPSLRQFEVVPWTRLADFYNKTVELLTRQVDVVRLIIAVIIVLSISNTMTMSVMERTVEIGTAMALGIRRRRILTLFLLEGGLLGVLGGAIGIAIGYALAWLISTVGIPMPPAPGMSEGFTAAIRLTPGIAWQALLLAVSTTLIASLYPAWRAGRLVIVEALRHNR
jgi:putative ABC transport system permease protein